MYLWIFLCAGHGDSLVIASIGWENEDDVPVHSGGVQGDSSVIVITFLENGSGTTTTTKFEIEFVHDFSYSVAGGPLVLTLGLGVCMKKRVLLQRRSSLLTLFLVRFRMTGI